MLRAESVAEQMKFRFSSPNSDTTILRSTLAAMLDAPAFTADFTDDTAFPTEPQRSPSPTGTFSLQSMALSFCNLLKEVYDDFGFKDVKVKFSTRPEVRAGSDEVWDEAEKALEDAVKEAGLEYELSPGEGAFYGPKLEFTLVDAIGREWQCGTLQADFILPERLDANYIATDGSKQRPVMLHRAILGSFERFIGILIENYAGKFPLWLAPVQIVVATITNDSDEYARSVIKTLEENGFAVEADLDSNKISYKIREHSLKKVPYILAIGKKEAEEGTVAVRTLGAWDQKYMPLDEFILKAKNKIETKDEELQF